VSKGEKKKDVWENDKGTGENVSRTFTAQKGKKSPSKKGKEGYCTKPREYRRDQSILRGRPHLAIRERKKTAGVFLIREGLTLKKKRYHSGANGHNT